MHSKFFRALGGQPLGKFTTMFQIKNRHGCNMKVIAPMKGNPDLGIQEIFAGL